MNNAALRYSRTVDGASSTMLNIALHVHDWLATQLLRWLMRDSV